MWGNVFIFVKHASCESILRYIYSQQEVKVGRKFKFYLIQSRNWMQDLFSLPWLMFTSLYLIISDIKFNKIIWLMDYSTMLSRKHTCENRKINDEVMKTYIKFFNSQSFVGSRVKFPLWRKAITIWPVSMLFLRKSSDSSHLKEDREKLNSSSTNGSWLQQVFFTNQKTEGLFLFLRGEGGELLLFVQLSQYSYIHLETTQEATGRDLQCYTASWKIISPD